MGIPWANVEEEDVCGRVSEMLVDGSCASRRGARWARREVGEDGLTTLTLDVAAEDLVDLLRAYDAYIQAAFDARLPDSGWCPVCVDEFAEDEYRDVWLCREEGEDPFAYMYDGE